MSPGGPKDPLAVAVERARAAWPGVAASAEAFAEHLSRLGDLASLRVEELYLAFAASKGDAKALEVLETRFLSKVDSAVSWSKRDGVDDLKQKLREALLMPKDGKPPKLASYAGRDSLVRWLRAVASNVARAQYESREPDRPETDEALERLMSVADSPESQLISRDQRAVFSAALRSALASLSSEARLELTQYYLEGLGVVELGALYHLAPSTVSRRLAKARQQLATQVRAYLTAERRLAGSEIDSLIRGIQTGFELSRSGLEGKR